MKRKKHKTPAEVQIAQVPGHEGELAFTGERYIPTEQGEIRLEHLHRYAVALDVVVGKDVLDIASGEGYGSNILATVANTVTGIDISEEAVLHARATYGNKSNLMFKQGSATKIDLPDHIFDVVVSFETIEHLAEQSKMLSEIRRVLKPAGVLIISSPNRPVYSEASGNHNAFHIKELDFKEFDSLLKKQFKAIRYLGQRLQIGSIVQTLHGDANVFRALSDDGLTVQQAAAELVEPVYFLALCAATESTIPTIADSIMQPEKLDLLKQYVGYANWAISSNKELDALRKLHSELNEEHHKVATWAQSLDKQIAAMTQLLTEREQQIALLSDDIVKRGEWALDLDAQLNSSRTELKRLAAERDNFVTRLAQVEKELGDSRELYVRLDQEHHKIATWAHALDKQLADTSHLLLDKDRQIAQLSDETVKRGEWALGLEQQLKSTQSELSKKLSERDQQIVLLNKSMVELSDELSRLSLDLVKADYEFKLRDQAHANELNHRALQFEQEKAQLLLVLANERRDIQDEISILRQKIHDLLQEKTRIAYSFSERERALSKEHAELERHLHERLLLLQEELRQVDKEWAKEFAAHENLAAREKNELNIQALQLQHQISLLTDEAVKRGEWALDLEQQLKSTQTELSRQLSEREQQIASLTDETVKRGEWALGLDAQLKASYTDLESVRKLYGDLSEEHHKVATWAQTLNSQVLTATQALAVSEQGNETLQVQLHEQINEARKLAENWELTRNALTLELNAIQSSRIWRLTAPIRKLFPLNNVSLSIAGKVEGCSIDWQSNPNEHIKDVSMKDTYKTATHQSNDTISSLSQLLELNGEAFITAAYKTLLQRNPDADGLAYYVNLLSKGNSKIDLLDQIYRSKEGVMRAVKLPGLDEARRINRWFKLPLIGYFLRKSNLRNSSNILEARLDRLAEMMSARFDNLERDISSLSLKMESQSKMAAGAAMISRLGYSSVDSWGVIAKLLATTENEFLETLFGIALGRQPETHESEYFSSLMQRGISKLHIIDSLFSCAECKNYLSSEHAPVIQGDVKDPSQGGGEIGLPPQPVSVDAESIHFEDHEMPMVSVIIPVYGKIEYTLMCLKSIQNNLPKVEFELIVVDDQSPDNTIAELSKVVGIKLLKNRENLGFIRSCNRGAEHAKGQYLCFLNNDTEVHSGWLDELVRTFHEFPGTGLAGSKFVYPNGTLQEAGGIIWQDGSAWNFGRNQDPALPIFNYAREVDYCSGASIMIPSSLFKELGGFDEHYLPAYCEDSDLALKVRECGYRVIYQPLSVVIHYEGITSGTDTSQGAKAYQIENSKKLFARWKERLKNHQVNGVDADNAKDRTAKRRVLVLDHCTPTPDQDAGSVTVFNLLLLLREMDFQVTFIPEDNFLYMPEYTTQLQRIGVEVLYAPYYTSVEQHLSETGGRYELAFLFRPVVVERHINTVRKYCPEAKVLYHTVDLHYLRMMRESTLFDDKSKLVAAEEMKQREFDAIRVVDASIVHSTAELEIIRPDLPNEKIYVYPLILDVQGTEAKFEDRHNIVFVGGYQHAPNVDAVRYFVKKVMPVLRRKLPGVRFYAVGSKPPQDILDLACDDVIITGFVEDLNPFLDKMRVSVAPLRYGAGIKGKIGTAMAAGLPIVATPVAVEGMSLTDGENILVADGHQAIAAAIIKLYQEENLWSKLSAAGTVFAEGAWGGAAAWDILHIILKDMGINTARGVHPLKLYSSPEVGSSVSQSVTDKKTANDELHPISIARSMDEFQQILSLEVFNKIRDIENQLIQSATRDHFTVNGRCVPCDKNVSFMVDLRSGGTRAGEKLIPNWRERIECPICHMNNRQRLIASLVKQRLDSCKADVATVYFMEQVTPIIRWAEKSFSQHNIIGSEYLGHEYKSGEYINGIRHEDVMNLSFDNESIDLIVSNDVFEHVPNPSKAYRECARVLRSGSIMIATIPFHANSIKSVVRAELGADGVTHFLPPSYHGNPVSADGSLVFTDFGWDVLASLREAGFRDAYVSIYASEEFSHLGGGQIVFEAVK